MTRKTAKLAKAARRPARAKPLIFLGGTCGATTWRDQFISQLDAQRARYFNPQLAPGVEWKSQDAAREKRFLKKADIVVMVITNHTTGMVSLLETCELLTKFNLDASDDRVMLAHVASPRPPRAGARASERSKDRLRAIEFLRQRQAPPRTVFLDSVDDVLSELLKRI